MTDKTEKAIQLKKVTVKDDFWSYFQNLVRDVVIPYQEKILNDAIPGIEKSHAIENFRIAAGEAEGEFYGQVFQDSDLAKWMEGAAYASLLDPSGKIEKSLEEVQRLVKKAQEPDGYLDTYFIIKEPEKRWQNLLECHELYCMGHMIEAAVAHYEVTGKTNFLEVAKKAADHIDSRFGKEKTRGIPGHEEIELALLRLFQATGETKYRDLAAYFINERGTEPNYFEVERKRINWTHWPMDPYDRKYSQNHKPVREQNTAEGHSVRAMYLYTAMADLAGELKDDGLKEACEKIWENAVNARMYITGGIGSTVDGEAFTIDYDLPNDTAYAETCASIGMVFFSRKMLELQPQGKYADIMEKELYNGILSGMQHDGSRFFYVNPLEVVAGVSGELYGYRHDLPQRPEWYACACCPPNVSRLIASLGKYVWGESIDGKTLYSHLFVGGTVETAGMKINLETAYPWKGSLRYTVLEAEGEKTLAVRIPGWCTSYELQLNGEKVADGLQKDGYFYLTRTWKSGDQLTLNLELPVKRVYANQAVRKDAGCVALMRGPVVYCLEEADNGKELSALRISEEAEIEVQERELLELGNFVGLTIKGTKEVSSSELYSTEPPREETVTMQAIPYYLWGNRGLGEMRVWIRR